MLQNILDKHRNIESYIDIFNESDDIDGFTDCDLFDSGSEEVTNPIPFIRDCYMLDENESDEIEIGSAQTTPQNRVETPHNATNNTKHNVVVNPNDILSQFQTLFNQLVGRTNALVFKNPTNTKINDRN